METQEQLAINRLLAAVDQYKASDLHLTPGSPPTLRVEGKLVPLNDEPILTSQFLEKLVFSLLNEEQKKKLEEEKEITFSYTFQNKARFKISVFYQQGNLSASLKLIPSYIRKMSELGLPSSVQRLVEVSKGLVIVAGPFGSGRTTTLASFINHFNQTQAKHIITIEKPVEYLFVDNKSIIEQREVIQDTPSFADGLKFVLEEDVDIVMISDIPDAEVIREIFNVVNSGRLVYAAMDADSSIHVIEKIINNFSSSEQNQIREQLANILEGIIVQKLISRTLVAEVLIPNQAIRSVIKSGSLGQIQNILQTSRGEGMISFDQALAEKVKQGEVNLNLALDYALDKENLQALVNQ